MSVSEPAISGKVILKTTLGDIEIELWSKEAPLATRNFVQLCMEGYYNGCIFHRVIKDFIAQTGDPTGTGTGGESIYDEKPLEIQDTSNGSGEIQKSTGFKDEFHSRLRFNRRGMVGMASSSPDQNKSQFFFTLAKTENLSKKHTVFGRVVGDTLFNLLKVNEIEVDTETDTPLFPPKIISTDIIWNPFNDIQPRVKKQEIKKQQKKKQTKKNLNLLSFGDEEEQEDNEEQEFIKPREEQKKENKFKTSSNNIVEENKIEITSDKNISNNNDNDKAEKYQILKSNQSDNKYDNNDDNGDSDDKEIKSFSERMKQELIEKGLKRKKDQYDDNNDSDLQSSPSIIKPTTTTTTTTITKTDKKKKIKGSLQFKTTSVPSSSTSTIKKKSNSISETDILNKLKSFKNTLTNKSGDNNNSNNNDDDDDSWIGHSLKFSKKSKLEYE